TTGTEGRHTALVCNLGQWVGLVHELRELVGTKEGVDHRRKCPCVDKVYGFEVLIITHIHSFLYGPSHSGKTDSELSVQLLSYSTYPTVRQVVDVVDYGFSINQADQVFYDRHDIFGGKYSNVQGGIRTQLFIDSVTPYISQIVTFIAEEKALDYLSCGLFIGSFSISQLAINLFNSFFIGVGAILLECIINDIVIGHVHIFLMEDN